MNEERINHLLKIMETPSPLSSIPNIGKIASRRSAHFEPIDDFIQMAALLEKGNSEACITRAQFISMQCEGEEAVDFFETHRESWGIPIFKENLLTTKEFKNGFLWTIKDYTTAFIEEGYLTSWFCKSYECLFIRNYQAWDFNEKPIMIGQELGSCKEIFTRFIRDYGVMDRLSSPVFSKEELQAFHHELVVPEERKFFRDIMMKAILQNPNWKN